MLSLVIFLPLIFAIALLVIPNNFSKMFATISSALVFVLSLFLLFAFDKSLYDLQFAEQISWIESLGISYFVGVDGISIWLLLLTTLLIPLVILSSNSDRKSFYFHILVLETFVLGTFLALDAFCFYIFFEAALIPMYFLIGIWGGPRKVYAAVKFFIFTMVGSLFMLIAIISLMFLARDQLGYFSASILDFYKLDIPFVSGMLLNPQNLMFFAFSLTFAIKVPMVPFHTWLPDAHVEAPTAGSVILAGVMLKLGAYGFLRWVMPLFPDSLESFNLVFLILAVVGIIYGALMAFVQTDIKKLVAYSSVSHMGYVILGLFSLNIYGITGGLYQMLNHGVSTSALFLLVGMIYARGKTRDINEYGGLAPKMPIYSILFFIVTMASIAVPGTNGFVGEVLILLGGFQANKILASLAVLGVVLGAVYMLYVFKKVFFGNVGSASSKISLDLNIVEILVLTPFVLLIFAMGLMPNKFLDFSRVSINHLVENQKTYSLQIHGLNIQDIEQNKEENLVDENVETNEEPNLEPEAMGIGNISKEIEEDQQQVKNIDKLNIPIKVAE